jgi:DNA polymerase family B
VSKKRYVGHSLEDPEQKMLKLDAKGIELVRRDQCPLVTKMQVRELYTTIHMLLYAITVSLVHIQLCIVQEVQLITQCIWCCCSSGVVYCYVLKSTSWCVRLQRKVIHGKAIA